MAGVSRTNSTSSKRKSRIVACANCRRQKTRCEVLEVKSQIAVRCHRCKTLDVACSYEDMDKSLFEVRLRAEETHTLSAILPPPASTSPAPSSKSTDEMLLELESMFQDLKIIQPSSTSRQSAPDSETPKIMGVEALPRRIRLWFMTFYHLSYSYDFHGDTLEDVNRPDWSAPLACVRNLHPRGGNESFPINGSQTQESLENLLSKDQIGRLLDIFSQQYAPSLCFDTIKASARSPLLRLICCTIVASRQPDSDAEVRELLVHRLQTVAEQMITKTLYNLQLFSSVESVKGLLITALWPSLSNDHESLGSENLSPRYIISCAITMARHLRLDECVDQALALRNASALPGETLDTTYFADLLDKARLWTSLVNSDSLLSLERGQGCHLVNHPESFNSLFELPHMVPTDIGECRDIRLRILGGVVQITASTLNTTIPSLQSKDVDVFYRRQRNSIRDLNELNRIVAPLPLMVPFEKFYFQTLSVICRSCQLLVYFNSLRTGRLIYESSPHPHPDFPLWYMHVKTYDLVLNFWGKDARSLAESILITILDIDATLLGTVPDYFFLHLAFTATYIIGLKFVSLNGLNAVTAGVECTLLSKVAETLCITARGHPDHPAQRCAHFIAGLLSLWENRDVLFRPSDEDDTQILGLNLT
ncbi:hypothetical protein VNI00_000115 [Paramarasmius palmivorus]|uniref:Zn(2)-C6 fungal-type domain-containing protein n=1 Tax=Paramarasmius palmivorus TaxID=297713 RepID=A0AAW0EGH0_9AGAR